MGKHLSNDVWDLPPVQMLIMETLAAKWRAGEYTWIVPPRTYPAARALELSGLITIDYQTATATYRAALTNRGQMLALPPEQQAQPVGYRLIVNGQRIRARNNNATIEGEAKVSDGAVFILFGTTHVPVPPDGEIWLA